ncbi:MAG: low temperature requirement protein A [Saprospiraceae bacterium]|nr:low temperature requirement protein A [Saprospiraceae bacterium]
MKIKTDVREWWGPPREFTLENPERKVSWLELFYDLVYVIAISRITHHLAAHFSLSSFLEYIYLFTMVYWGWLNGSLYYDLHGSEGLRTRLMTLWQIMIVAALAITLESDPNHLVFNVSITLLIMQFYITYLWWSVGVYDKNHARLSPTWTIPYLISALLIFGTLFLHRAYVLPILYISLLINYLPPFITQKIHGETANSMVMSSSMSERLGLFTIIIFGEVILGIITAVDASEDLSFNTWVKFALATGITFALWWLFFTLVSDRHSKIGLVKSSWLQISYIPTLMALSITGIAFSSFFGTPHAGEHATDHTFLFGCAIAIFLSGIVLMGNFLDYPTFSKRFKIQIRALVIAGALLIFGLVSLDWHITPLIQLILVLSILLLVILGLNYLWYSLQAKGKTNS